MDGNKLKVLQEVGYTFNPTCGSCAHALFQTTASQWGVCQLHRYQHEKHKTPEAQGGPTRMLSIHTLGSCKSFQRKDLPALSAWREFMR